MAGEKIMRAIDSQDWLAPAENRLKQGLDKVFENDRAAGRPVENALHGVWLGHALHPALTDIPVGAWTAAVVLDMIEGISGSSRYRAGADAVLGIGIAGSVAAAVTGVTDWKDVSRDARRAGLVHGLLNTVALGLYVTSAVQRKRGNRQGGRLSAYLGFGVSLGSAWLGGHLVAVKRAGVEARAEAAPPEDFVNVARFSELEESKPHRADCGGYPVVVVRKGEKIYAISETCTHLGGSLSEGTVEGDCIRCPLHGSLFSLKTGEVVESPAVGPEKQFEVRVADDLVAVRLKRS